MPRDDALSERLSLIADEMRGVASEGLTWCDDEYQVRRFHRILRLSAELTSAIDGRGVDELEPVFQAHLDHVCPRVGTNSVIWDDDGRILLIQRRDNGQWAVPGGLVEIGETPSGGAAREVFEETGLRVQPQVLVGVYDWAAAGWPGGVGHLHCYVFLCRTVDDNPPVTQTQETLDLRWVSRSELPDLALGHAAIVRDALEVLDGRRASAFFT